jgi:hypothetical protein
MSHNDAPAPDIVEIANVILNAYVGPDHLHNLILGLRDETVRLRSALREIINDIPWAEQIAKRALSEDRTALERFDAWRLT